MAKHDAKVGTRDPNKKKKKKFIIYFYEETFHNDQGIS